MYLFHFEYGWLASFLVAFDIFKFSAALWLTATGKYINPKKKNV